MIEGASRQLIPIRAYRALHHLPESFGLAFFEPKHAAELASIDGLPPDILTSIHTAAISAATLSAAALSAALRDTTTPDALSAITPIVSAFSAALVAANPAIGLKDVELDYAVNSFADMLNMWAFRAMAAQPDFDAAYRQWLNDSVRLATQVFPYEHQADTLHVRIINTVFGRIGLRVERKNAVDYVSDRVHACPAEGFMASLCRDVVMKLSSLSPR